MDRGTANFKASSSIQISILIAQNGKLSLMFIYKLRPLLGIVRYIVKAMRLIIHIYCLHVSIRFRMLPHYLFSCIYNFNIWLIAIIYLVKSIMAYCEIKA